MYFFIVFVFVKGVLIMFASLGRYMMIYVGGQYLDYGRVYGGSRS